MLRTLFASPSPDSPVSLTGATPGGLPDAPSVGRDRSFSGRDTRSLAGSLEHNVFSHAWHRYRRRLSGKAMARTGLRMIPTFPLPPLKFRTAGFPSVRLQGRNIRRSLPVGPVCHRPSCSQLPPFIPVQCQERWSLGAPPCERQPLYPRGPRSGPGYAVPVHHHLLGPIRPSREHIPTSPQSGLYTMSSLCIFAYA